MSNKNKKLLGIITFLPFILLIIYFFTFFLSFLGMIIPASNNQEPNMGLFMGNFIIAFIIIGFMSILSIGLLIYYIIHITNNKNLDDNNRLVWILLIVFANLIGYGIYWYLQIWKGTDELKEKM